MNQTQSQFEAEYADMVRRVNGTLLNYGWAIAPHFMVGRDFYALDGYCKTIIATPPKDKKTVRDEIRKHLGPYAFMPHPRACSLYRSTQLPFIKEFAHFIERGILHYYKRDYFSSILSMLLAIEGILRLHTNYTQPKASMPELLRLLRAKQPITTVQFFAGRFPLYRDTLVEILDRWIYKPTGQADFDLSHLNRHYALHGLGQGSFYSMFDCERLFLLFDLYVETLVCETGTSVFGSFLPDTGDNAFVDARTSHYIALLTQDLALRGAPCDGRSIYARAPRLLARIISALPETLTPLKRLAHSRRIT